MSCTTQIIYYIGPLTEKNLSILSLEHWSGLHNSPSTAHMQMHCPDAYVEDKTLMLMEPLGDSFIS